MQFTKYMVKIYSTVSKVKGWRLIYRELIWAHKVPVSLNIEGRAIHFCYLEMLKEPSRKALKDSEMGRHTQRLLT